MFWFLLFSFIYLNIGFVLASFCWNRYEPCRSKFGFIDFLLWPISTLENIGRWESEGGVTPIISDFKSDDSEVIYKVVVTILWPLKIIANIFLIVIALVIFALIILARLIATIAILAAYIVVIPARKLFKAKSLGNINLAKIWQKRLVVVEF